MALMFSRFFTKNIIAKVVTVRGLVDQAHVHFSGADGYAEATSYAPGHIIV